MRQACHVKCQNDPYLRYRHKYWSASTFWVPDINKLTDMNHLPTYVLSKILRKRRSKCSQESCSCHTLLILWTVILWFLSALINSFLSFISPPFWWVYIKTQMICGFFVFMHYWGFRGWLKQWIGFLFSVVWFNFIEMKIGIGGYCLFKEQILVRFLLSDL